jgi:low affinity Fe/Cu permease
VMPPANVPAPPENTSALADEIRGFRRFAERTARLLSTPSAFLVAVATVVAWFLSGPAFHFSSQWQIVISTATSVVTFLMVFLLQNTQARDSRALHLKLDELLRAVRDARTGLVGLERLPDAHLAELEDEFTRLGDEERRSGESLPPVPDAPAE